jgi:hypothetical protein
MTCVTNRILGRVGDMTQLLPSMHEALDCWIPSTMACDFQGHGIPSHSLTTFLLGHLFWKSQPPCCEDIQAAPCRSPRNEELRPLASSYMNESVTLEMDPQIPDKPSDDHIPADITPVTSEDIPGLIITLNSRFQISELQKL